MASTTRNGDGSEDDPGKMEFLIDGKLVLSEQLAPFGDSFATGSITTSNGQHTFQVRALTDSGTLLASNTVTATIGSQTPPPPPPPSSTGAVKQTIANGATLSGITNWRGVYDANGDGSEDDPGKMEFLIDGKLVLSEQLAPFGDSFADRIDHDQQRPAHLPGARPHRQRHPARQQHRHRHHRQPDTPTAA